MLSGSRAQASIELIVTTAVVLLIVLLIFNHYFSISDSTIALITIKTAVIKELNVQDGLYTIKKVEFRECGAGSVRFNVASEPSTLDAAGIGVANINNIRNEIAARTKWAFGNIALEINGTVVCP